jgi:recombination protein RecA
MYGAGISREGEIIDLGVVAGIVDKAGAWFSYNGDRIGQGKDNVREYLREHPAMAVEIENRVREKLGVVARTPSVADAAASAASAPKAASSKASKAIAAEPDSDDDL